jgi:serine/threonine protein kinase/tetratricopeptide (TPR) repeat protein
MSLQANALLGPYRVISKIGEGGMGEVYRAHDDRLNRDVAIKVLPERLAQDTQALARFEREAKAIAALSHPNIINVFDVGVERGMHYVVTELLQGQPLRDVIDWQAQEWKRVVEIGVALAEGLAAAHARGVVHRDLKPENVFLLPDGRIKILDFGLARMLPPVVMSDVTMSIVPGATARGTILGTIGYMAPEQVRGEPGEPACDQFALGCVLYELVSGQRAFPGRVAADVMTAILRDRPVALKDVPAAFEQVIARCMEKAATARYSGMLEVSAVLTGLLREGTASIVMAPVVEPVNSIAVLPFVNSSGDPDAEFLSDGIADSITSSLARIHSIRVTPRSAAFRFKGHGDDPQGVGRELGVRVVLTGRVAQHSGSLVVRAELTDVLAGQQVWGERYHRKAADVFEIEEDVARGITESLRVALSGEDEKRLAKRYTTDSEAYQLYLRGRFHWVQRTPQAMQKAAEFFEQAIAHDPGFALAFAGLADCYSVLTTYFVFAPKQGWAKAKAAAAAALALDSELAEAHASWGFIKFFGEWDYSGAEAAFQKAIRLNESYSVTRCWYACLLGALKRFQDAEREIRELQKLDPLSPLAAYLAGGAAVFDGRPEEGVRRCLKGLEAEPDFPLLRLWLGIAYQAQGRLAKAITELETAQKLLGAAPLGMGSLAHAYAQAGRHEEATAFLNEMLWAAEAGPSDGYYIALTYEGLGDEERALEWLERASLERGVGTIAFMASCDPRMDRLRKTPRYRAVLDRMGLP